MFELGGVQLERVHCILILGDSTISGLIEKKMSRNRKINVRYFPGAKIKDMYYYAIPLLKKKPGNIILHVGSNDAPYKSDTDILKDLIELKDFILEKSPSCKRITFSTPTVRNNRERAKKNTKHLTNRLKKQGIPYITYDNITHKRLHREGLHLNSVGFSILAENVLLYSEKLTPD